MKCPLCNEEILDADNAVPLNNNERGGHHECVFRLIAGSVGHQKHECSCYNKEDTSENGMTFREAAKASLTYAQDQIGKE